MIVRKSIEVQAGVEQAFDVFTSRMSDWWPLVTHSIGHERVVETTIEPRVGGLVYETWDDGSTHDWADVVAFEPPARLELNWRVGDTSPTKLEVRFSAAEGGTRVDIEHSGWDSRERFESYEAGWDGVLSSFRSSSALGGANVSQSLLK